MTVRGRRNQWGNENHQKISDRHREWGFDVPAVDIDFLLIEYDHSTPKALIEYKGENANINFETITNRGAAPHSYNAIKTLADNSQIPFYVVIYTNNLKQYYVIPMNSFAKKYIQNEAVLTEEEYVTFLYNIRNRKPPQSIIEKL